MMKKIRMIFSSSFTYFILAVISFFCFSYSALNSIKTNASGVTLEPETPIIKQLATKPESKPTIRPDPCQSYAEKAKSDLLQMESGLKRVNDSSIISESAVVSATVSAAYSSYYLVCRDLEHRESE